MSRPTSSEYESDVTIVSRREWNALPSRWGLTPLPLPQSTFYHNYAETYWCKEQDDCKRIVSDLQKKHIDLGFPDIQFNFLVGGDGNVYEGVGWSALVVDLKRRNMDSCAKFIVGFIGRPDDARYMRRMFHTHERLLSLGIKNKYLKAGDKFNIDMDYLF